MAVLLEAQPLQDPLGGIADQIGLGGDMGHPRLGEGPAADRSEERRVGKECL